MFTQHNLLHHFLSSCISLFTARLISKSVMYIYFAPSLSLLLLAYCSTVASCSTAASCSPAASCLTVAPCLTAASCLTVGPC
jgi:hypothetical protein